MQAFQSGSLSFLGDLCHANIVRSLVFRYGAYAEAFEPTNKVTIYENNLKMTKLPAGTGPLLYTGGKGGPDLLRYKAPSIDDSRQGGWHNFIGLQDSQSSYPTG